MSSQIAYAEVAKSLDKFLTEHDPKHLILNESDHASGLNVKALQSPEVLAVFAEHERNNINLEARKEFQGKADEVAAGTTSPAELASYAVNEYDAVGDRYASSAGPNYEARGDLIQKAAASGIKVNFVEEQGTLEEYVAILDEGAAVNGKVNKLIKKEARFISDADSANPDPENKELSIRIHSAAEQDVMNKPTSAKQRMEEFVDLRNSNDGHLADNILQATHGEKTVTLYGLEHGAHEKDLDEILGPGTLRIVMVNDDEVYADRSQMDYNSGRQAPAAYLNLATGVLITGEEAYAAAEKAHPNEKAPEAVAVAEKAKAPEAVEQSPFMAAIKAAGLSGIVLSDSNATQPDCGFSLQAGCPTKGPVVAAGRI